MSLFFRLVILLGFEICFTFHSSAQKLIDGTARRVHIIKATDDIKLDGLLDEEAWNNAESMGEFFQYFPTDTVMASATSIVKFTYDDQFIYVGAKMIDIEKGGYITPTLRRDFRGRGNDGIHIMFDTFDDQTNAFLFGVNPFNVQREGIISNAGRGRNSFSLSWDNKWFSEAKQYDGYWVAEFAIPFKSIRFKEGATVWGLNAFRIDSKQNERSTWGNTPTNFGMVTMGFSGKMVWDKPLKKSGPNISLIPFSSGGILRNHDENKPTEYSWEIGGDAKIAVSSSLNLDLTINPDFSQVEVDQQVTNLDRFELFFPERRQFFLENADLFNNFGSERIRPFFSRRIGIAEDTVNKINIQNKIHYGLRLSGKLNRYWRVGLLNMQTAKDNDIGLISNNFTVGVIERRLFQRSTLSAFFINKQSLTDSVSDKFTLNPEQYNRVLGLDYNLATDNNRWTGKLFYHHAFDHTNRDDQFAHGLDLEYRQRNFRFQWRHEIVGENYEAAVGFIPRSGFNRVNPSVRLEYYPQSKVINRHGPELELSYTWDKYNSKTDHKYEFKYNIDFQNLARLEFSLSNNYTFLFDAFDPSGLEGKQLAAGTSYRYTNVEATYESDLKKNLYYNLAFVGGEFFNGSRWGLTGDLNYRLQPLVLLTLNFSYDRVRLPNPYKDSDLLLIGPRFDFTFTRNVFFTTFIQYNNQIDNLNINARFQWRFKPVSDLYVVYTDNYYPSSLKVKNRAMVLKLTYWLNL